MQRCRPVTHAGVLCTANLQYACGGGVDPRRSRGTPRGQVTVAHIVPLLFIPGETYVPTGGDAPLESNAIFHGQC